MAPRFASYRLFQALTLGRCVVGAILMAALSVSAGTQRKTTEGWHPPQSCIFTRNPVPATRSSVEAGKKIFLMRCAGCHGARGHGDGEDAPQLRVRPAVLSSHPIQEQTDGALWWKITFGNRPMPGYGFRLSMADRWNLVNYLRTLRDE
jgi:mono/diheme cytochrome c family protein